jgi:hypothetical protein
MFVVGFTAGGAPFGVEEWHDRGWIDDIDLTSTTQDAEPF